MPATIAISSISSRARFIVHPPSSPICNDGMAQRHHLSDLLSRSGAKLTMSGTVTKMADVSRGQGSSQHGSGETIGARLRRLRQERGLSQRELASPGVSYAYISRIEAGSRQPSVKALRRLAAKLNVTADYLETGSSMDPRAARELRVADLELAMRLGEAEGVEEPLQAAIA